MDPARQQRLSEFVEWTQQHITGDEKGEAQIYLDHLLRAFGQRGLLEVGGTPEFRIRQKTDDHSGVTFADYVWKPVVLIEMKKRGTDLRRHFRQAFDYWIHSVPNRPAYTVLCNFDEFHIYDFNESLEDPLDTLTLEELPQRFGPLAFLFPTNEKPTFRVDRLEVTKAAADLLAAVYNVLAKRQDVGPTTAQRFILQTLIALFSEDIDLLPKYFFTQLLDECIDPPKAFDLLDGMFRAMNTPGGVSGGRYKGVPYFNGGIFATPAPVELGGDEVSRLKRASEYNWAHISPDIFGTIFQHSMNDAERHKYGGHYTTPTDIMKIVKPTIVDPWRTAIAEARKIEQLMALRQRLYSFRVLDPACGSGNFLYIAYREFKRIEAELVERIAEVSTARDRAQPVFGFVTSKQFFGMDIVPFAVELAKVTMTLGHKLAIDELHVDEPALPLDNLDENIRCVDALIDWPIDGSTPADFDPKKKRERTPWPKADVIIGNPPFLGAKRLKPERGADYVNAVRKAYPKVPGMADYCVYWIARAQEHLPMCTPADPLRGRAGLVGTQNIRNNKSREGGLDQVVKSGTIVEAVDNQPWSGEANVHVSIVNWVKHEPPPTKIAGAEYETGAFDTKRLLIPERKKLWYRIDAAMPLFPAPAGKRRRSTTVAGKRGSPRKDKSFELTFREATFLNSALSDQVPLGAAHTLSVNEGFCYTGQYPRHAGFMLSGQEAAKLLAANAANREVVHPFVVGREFLGGALDNRWVIDFQRRDILEASAFADVFAHLKQDVLPIVRRKAELERKRTGRDIGQDQNWLRTWWQHFRSRPELIAKISGLRRYLVCSRVTKRPIFAFLDSELRPGDALSCFTLDDDYSFGVLQSDAHWRWFVAKCSKLKSDYRYTPESVFDTFAWPQGNGFDGPAAARVGTISEAGRRIRQIRDDALKNMTGGLRALYRTLEIDGKNPLKDAHAALDAAVLDAYGFDPKKDLLKQLLDLNLEVARRIERGQPVVAPGTPPSYPQDRRAELVTEDCIRAGQPQ
ncbi:MAG: class I SAM-dependent DNA methyltransferase [Phycisphaerales bacterium]|nr:class I SAM-dependent DNA methyltransferase [Phycisphaerales bacterium]